MKRIKSYAELITIPTFEERLEYLKVYGSVGIETFGNKRWLNQMFYQLPEWRNSRDEVIIRDETYRDWETDRKSTRLNSSHSAKSRMPSSA